MLGRWLLLCGLSGLVAKIAARRGWTRFSTTACAQGPVPDGAQVTTGIIALIGSLSTV